MGIEIEGMPSLVPIGMVRALDRAIDLFLRNVGTFGAILAVYQVPFCLLQFRGGGQINFVSETMWGIRSLFGNSATVATHPPFEPKLYLLYAAAEFVLAPIVITALVVAISSSYLSGKTSLIHAFRVTAERIVPMLALTISSKALLIAVLLVPEAMQPARHHRPPLDLALEIVAAYLISIACSFVITFATGLVLCTMMLEDADVRTSIVRTFRRFVFSSRKWRSFLALCVVSGIWFGFTVARILIWTTSFDELGIGTVIRVASTGALDLVTSAITLAFITIYYYDTRVREEAFDLHVAADGIAQRISAGATTS